LVVALVLAAGACVDLDPRSTEPSAEPSTASTSQGVVVAGCSIIVCTENAATAGDGLLFDELDLFNRPNYAGTRMLGAHLDVRFSSLPVRMMIFGDVLWAYDQAGGRWYTGTDLIHMIVDFQHVPTGTYFQIRLEAFTTNVAFLAGPPESIPAYAFKARRSPTENFNFDICSNAALVPDPTWSGGDHYAVVYRGDRYDPMRKRLLPNNVNDGWSFLACNGSAASKMHLWRHTYAGAFDDRGNPVYMTNLDQRTALLKAITADYCGGGLPEFTVTGTPLAFATAMEPATFPRPRLTLPPTATLEALWGPAGAHCLDNPRIWPKSGVEMKCGRKFDSCPPGVPPPGWWNTHYAVTVNP